MVVGLLPAGLVAVIVTEAVAYTAVGVPTSSPVVELSVTPLGSVPLVTVHVTTTPPTLVTVAPLTGLFLVNVNGEPAYEMSGASS